MSAGCSLKFTGRQQTVVSAGASATGTRGHAFDLSGSFSAMMWINPPYMPPTNEQTLLAYTTNHGLRFGIITDQTATCYPTECPYGVLFTRLCYVMNGMNACEANYPKEGGWHHMAYTWDNSSYVMRIYIDGEVSCNIDFSTETCMDGDETVSCIQKDSDLWDKWSTFFHLGDIPSWGQRYHGEMDEFRLYSRLLSQSEIQSSLYTSPDLTDDDLMIHYNFDECSGQDATDSTGNFDGKHGSIVNDGATLGTTPLYVASGAPVYSESTVAGARFSIAPKSGASATYDDVGWTVLGTNGSIISAGRTMKVTSVDSRNAELSVDGGVLQNGSQWPVEKRASPQLQDAGAPPEFVGLFVGFQEAHAGWVELTYDVEDSSGAIVATGGKLLVTVRQNQGPLLGNGGQAVRFDVNDYLGNLEFVLRHRTWTNDSSIFGTYNATEDILYPAVKNGETGAGHGKGVTVEFWTMQTKNNMLAKQTDTTPAIGGMSMFTVGNSDSPGFGESPCMFEQPFTACAGRFSTHFPWNFDHPYSYFDYGWITRGAAGRTYFDAQPYIDDWMHFAITADPDNNVQRMYANGQLMAQSTSDGPARDLHSIILGAFPAASSTHKGDMDEFRIYERVKTQAEIQADMHRRANTSDESLLGYWHFNDCGKDGPMNTNCEDISAHDRPLTSAMCGQMFASKMTPGWGEQAGAPNQHDKGTLNQLINCKNFSSPVEADSAGWPTGIPSLAPLAGSWAPLQPLTQEAEDAGEFDVVIDALDPDYLDELQLEIVALQAPGVTVLDDSGNETGPGSRIQMVRVVGAAGAIRNPMYREVKLRIELPASRQMVMGSITLQVHDSYGAASEPVTYAIHAFVCEAGYEFNWRGLGDDTCLPCAAGYSSNGTGGECQPCEVGRYASTTGHTECLDVPLGTMAQERGSDSYAECLPGQYRGEAETYCEICLEGTYQNLSGQSACLSCEPLVEGSSSNLGSKSAADCTCPAGTFLTGTPSRCRSCLEGLYCPGGEDPPLQQAGFWADITGDEDDPYSVYMCRDQGECPGPAALASCAAGREGRACNNCQPGHYSETDGSCRDCGGTAYLQLVGLFLILIAGTGLCAYLLRVDPSTQSLTIFTVVATGAQAATALQGLTAISKLAFNWLEPAKSLMRVMSIFTFDLDVFNVTCLTQSDSPVGMFVLQLFAYPGFCCVVLLSWFLSKVFSGRDHWDSLVNGNGMVLTLLFITISLIVLAPFQCRANPNGSLSMASQPGVVCWDTSEHIVLVILGVIGLFAYPFTILSWVTYITVKLPSRIASGKGLTSVARYRFLFHRFKQEHYYYGLVYLVRNFLIALTPVALVSYPAGQLVAMSGLIILATLAQVWLKPWRTLVANTSDMLMNTGLVLVIVGAAPLLEADAETRSMLGVVLAVYILTLPVAAISIIALSVYLRWRPASKYSLFLCHHKGGAGALARYFKTMVLKHFSVTIFLDSDQLKDLDGLFDTVKCRVEHLVVLLTAETQKRVWCAGEMATAFLNHVDIKPVICDGYTLFSEEEFLAIEASWSDSEKHLLLTNGISTDMIRDAYMHMKEIKAAVMPSLKTRRSQETLCVEVTASCGFKKNSLVIEPPTDKASILISCASADAEAIASCLTLQHMLQIELQREVALVTSREDMERYASAEFFLAYLTSGVLADPIFADALLVAVDRELGMAPFAGDGMGFQFPGADYYDRLAAVGFETPELGPDKGPQLARAYKALLSILALRYTPHGSAEELGMEVRNLAKCTAMKKRPGEGSRSIPTSSAQTVRDDESGKKSNEVITNEDNSNDQGDKPGGGIDI